MAVDLRALKAEVEELERRLKHHKALDALAQLVELEPDNARWPQKAGEIHRRLGHVDEAIRSFGEAARRYARVGFLVKAIALCKVILGLDPEHAETQQLFAELSPPRRSPRPRAARHAGEPAPPAPAPATSPAPPARAPEAAPAPAPAGAAPAKKPPSIPPTARLDAARLREVVAAARREERPADHPGAVYEIPLDEEIETALEGAFASSARPPSAEARPARASSETRALPRTPLLSALDERALRALTERMALRRFAQGERIIREGEVGEALYILVEGQVLVYREGPPRVPLTHLDEGDFFGEIALLTKRARSASVEAVGGEVVVLELPRAMLSELVDEHPAVLGVLLRFFRERLVESLLETGELFAPFTNAERRDLVARFAFIEVEPETCLIAQGRTADGLYLLLAGELQVVRADEGGASRSLARLGPGSVVGEISLLTSGPAVASIHARGKCWLLRLDRHTFNEVILTHPQVLAFLTELADARRALNAAILSEERPYQELALPLL